MTTPGLGEICWNELTTPDVKKSKDFYSQVFGWKFRDHKNDASGDTYTIIEAQGKEFGGMWQIPADQQGKIPPHWMAYILVADAKSALEKAKLHGAVIMKEITEASGMGRFAIIVDPTGAHIALWETVSQK